MESTSSMFTINNSNLIAQNSSLSDFGSPDDSKMKAELNRKHRIISNLRNKLAEIRGFLTSLLQKNENNIDMFPQILQGLNNIDILREKEFRLKERIFLEDIKYFY